MTEKKAKEPTINEWMKDGLQSAIEYLNTFGQPDSWKEHPEWGKAMSGELADAGVAAIGVSPAGNAIDAIDMLEGGTGTGVLGRGIHEISKHLPDMGDDLFPLPETAGAPSSMLSTPKGDRVTQGRKPMEEYAQPDAMIAGTEAKGTDFGKVSEAEYLEQGGTDPHEILAKTGYQRDPQGGWVKDIPDIEAKLKPNAEKIYKFNKSKGKKTYLRDIYDHQKGWDAYPDIANTEVHFSPQGLNGISGGMVSSYNVHTGAPAAKPYIRLNSSYMNDSAEIKTTLDHEIQHLIDKYAGRSNGSNQEKIWDAPAKAGVKATRAEMQADVDRLDAIIAKYDASGQPKSDLYKKAKVKSRTYKNLLGQPDENFEYLTQSGEWRARVNEQSATMTAEELGKKLLHERGDPIERKYLHDRAKPLKLTNGKVVYPKAESIEQVVNKIKGERHPISGNVLRRPFNDMTAEYGKAYDLIPEKALTPEELVKMDATIMATPGDRTRAGQTLLSVNGKRLGNDGTVLDGGLDFMRRPEQEAWWASNPTIMSAYAKRVGKLEKQYDAPVIANYMTMGIPSGDFSEMASHALRRMMRGAEIPATERKLFDTAVRGMGIDWPGWAKVTDEFLRDMPGGDRGRIIKLMEGAAWQDKGFPDIGSLRKALTKPELMDVPDLHSGMGFSRTTDQLIKSGFKRNHPSYKWQGKAPEGGGYLGKFEGLEPIPHRVMFGDWNRARDAHPKGGPNEPQSMRDYTFRASGVHQRATPQWLDGIYEHDKVAKRLKEISLNTKNKGDFK